MGAQLPLVAGSAHDSHCPAQVELQHTPLLHVPEAQSLPSRHSVPSGFWHTPSAFAKQQNPNWQVPVEQSLSVPHVAPLGFLQSPFFVQKKPSVASQSLSAAQPDLQVPPMQTDPSGQATVATGLHAPRPLQALFKIELLGDEHSDNVQLAPAR
jgi:hypothetical protein